MLLCVQLRKKRYNLTVSATIASKEQSMAQDEFKEHIACTLAYLFFFIGAILLLTMPPYSKNKTVRRHAWQSILLTVTFMAFWFICATLTRISGQFLSFLLGSIMTTSWFAFLGAWVYAMIQAYNGQRLEIPLISKLSENFS